MKRAQRKKVFGSRGFTLGETLVAISLSSIVAGVAIPATGRLMESYRLANATHQLTAEIGRTRMQAIGQRKFAVLVIQGNGTYARFVSSDGVSYGIDGTLKHLPEGIAVSVGPTGAPAFDRQGLANAASVITLSNGHGQKTVMMNILGRVWTS